MQVGSHADPEARHDEGTAEQGDGGVVGSGAEDEIAEQQGERQQQATCDLVEAGVDRGEAEGFGQDTDETGQAEWDEGCPDLCFSQVQPGALSRREYTGKRTDRGRRKRIQPNGRPMTLSNTT